ncbi:hypothetical protein B0T19DRAFT_53180 [Cercophora scortea]|uniref:Transmembrane protein n=1 Tax=Cercophora scortea TaxID=314031 RepID=A0AAE0J4N5_9PEZI|nr:hypothetical protein B0T19DRAFT_53180 [Cercophora scortea]
MVQLQKSPRPQHPLPCFFSLSMARLGSGKGRCASHSTLCGLFSVVIGWVNWGYGAAFWQHKIGGEEKLCFFACFFACFFFGSWIGFREPCSKCDCVIAGGVLALKMHFRRLLLSLAYLDWLCVRVYAPRFGCGELVGGGATVTSSPASERTGKGTKTSHG